MGREILFFALLHEIRGSLTSLMGWHSILEGEGGLALDSMGRSIEGLRQSSVEFSSTIRPGLDGDVVNLGLKLREFSSDWEVVGDARVYLDICRLLSALELAGPSRIEVSKDSGRVVLQLMDLSARGVRCLESQTSKELLALAEVDGRDWGVVLLKETVRTVTGSTISVTDATSVSISFVEEA
jgi:hypothetical protein